MGEISIMRANHLARPDFTPVALQQAGGRGRIAAGKFQLQKNLHEAGFNG